jgi:transposase
MLMVVCGMARPCRIDKAMVAEARRIARRTRDANELRAAQSILLPALNGSTLDQTAALLGVGRATVSRLQSRFRRLVLCREPIHCGWGGRRRMLMDFEEEKKFLEPWVQRAQAGGILVVSPIRAALAQKLGRSVAATVAYRMLARHGWRKVAPDTRHPKSDPLVQEEWKKNSRRRWQPW